MKKEKNLIENQGLINTYRKFRIKNYINKKNIKRRFFYFLKYKSFLLSNNYFITPQKQLGFVKTIEKSFINTSVIGVLNNNIAPQNKNFKLQNLCYSILYLYNCIFIKNIKPCTNAQRFQKKSFLIKFKPLLTFFKKNSNNKAGRNNMGNITVFTKGRKKKNNLIILTKSMFWDFNLRTLFSLIRNKNKIISLNKHLCGSYSLTPYTHGSEIGQYNFTSNLPKNFWRNFLPGNLVLLRFITRFSIISNIYINNIRKYTLANGTFSQIVEIFYDYNLVKIVLPSKYIKICSGWDFAFLGRNSQIDYKYNVLGKAGFNILKGKKSKVRGVARNPVDHPHGGRTKTNQPEVSIWGWVTKKGK